MKKRRSVGEIKDIVEKIKELGLTYAAGAKHFNIPVWKLYDYNKTLKSQSTQAPDTQLVSEEEADKKEKNTPVALIGNGLIGISIF